MAAILVNPSDSSLYGPIKTNEVWNQFLQYHAAGGMKDAPGLFLQQMCFAADLSIKQYEINKEAQYARGRPAKAMARTPLGYEYLVDINIDVDSEALSPLRLEAGSFVLICNLPRSQERNQWTALSLLELYKNQSGIEQNFGFLKDPVIVNSIFLKKPTRIEVLGLVLLIALLIWRLMERCMRHHLDKTDTEITGWKNRLTKRPTSFMMTTKFISILVAKSGNQRQLVKPLRPVQIEFLRALNVSPEVFIEP